MISLVAVATIIILKVPYLIVIVADRVVTISLDSLRVNIVVATS